ncbi:triphosphoribosyl-dephospho-CoA synthase [Pediococcus inopinatus]|uniref:triphosphoribosyl-dephospho-CoA synthase n=1 Tax=Pediococcus inopinatus TaxID=114090 RepID=UPI00070BBBB9|nr:triphosphoribosyl-dephospho-CoA synthase [Pediococcus inopinatus]AVK99843.1 hypothetical protein PI20285_03880 [Pediococcus inopinatus]KRN62764.1 triphosphoribosyl-dephospho-CoA synthase MdcB [Pediococcus inopinatus]
MIRVSSAEKLATQAVNALKWEARFSPKPGLVTKISNGSHTDMNIDLFLRSADSLYETFLQIAVVSEHAPISRDLREQIGAIGRKGEQKMFETTHGINTHKGAIWALGVLVSVTSSANTTNTTDIFEKAGQLAQIPDRFVNAHAKPTYVSKAKQQYHVNGAREEAADGFPNVEKALNIIRTSKQIDQDQWLKVLCTLYANVDDTNVIHRSNLKVLRQFQNEARSAYEESDTLNSLAFRDLQKTVDHYQISPGGCADLFAATYFLHNFDL